MSNRLTKDNNTVLRQVELSRDTACTAVILSEPIVDPLFPPREAIAIHLKKRGHCP
jgi:hypothetical protein